MATDWSNPLTELRKLVASAILDYAVIVDRVGGKQNIQIFDQPVDARGNLMKGKKIDRRIQLNSEDGDVQFDDSSDSARFVRSFSIEVRKEGIGGLGAVEWFEWHITKALSYLYMMRKPGTEDPIIQPSPLRIIEIKLVRNDRELVPVNEPEEWSMVCMIAVHAEVSFVGLTTT